MQPSPLATLSASLRICEELEVQVGTFVGHVTRFEALRLRALLQEVLCYRKAALKLRTEPPGTRSCGS